MCIHQYGVQMAIYELLRDVFHEPRHTGLEGKIDVVYFSKENHFCTTQKNSQQTPL